MTAEELLELLEDRPFRPLRLHLADGRVREIRDREMAFVSRSHVAIGLQGDDESKVPDRMTFCSIPNIVEVEQFDIAGGSGSNGDGPTKKRRGR
jgi:hypothetical protein